ncbi:SRPBCC family protein [Rhizosaccharibacter radicis]|uniref:SRPBCC family protein n=1 Tax=Rhizosaccharibacter radicis TaxID=2782605 RepID=A0ABT1VT90_9PROT|nr:SRPBCC family protein [Acetobacteraceae bacterium KSS12]
MAGGIMTAPGNRSWRHKSLSTAPTGDLTRGLGWFSIGLGMAELLTPGLVTRSLGTGKGRELARLYGVREIATGVGILTSRNPAPWVWARVGGDLLDIGTVVAGSGDRPSRKGRVVLALVSLAGITALDIVCGQKLGRESLNSGGMRSDPADVERSITIGRTANELHALWRKPETLPRVMAHAATIRAAKDGRLHWRVKGPFGHGLDWESETVDDRAGEGLGWRSLPSARVPNEGLIRFRPATGGRGTVATLRVRFEPPGGVVGETAVHLMGGLVPAVIADTALRRFKSLAETGEIPTTERQPAARADTR